MTTPTGSRYFRLQRFRSLLKKHLATSGRFNGAHLTVDAHLGGFLGLVGGERTKALQIDSESESLFESGWEDISIRVFRSELFVRAKSLGEEYEQLTQRAVTVICYFEPAIACGDA